MMDILILANFTRDFSSTDNGRFSYLAAMLTKDNHEVEIVTSAFNHTTKRHRDNEILELPYNVTFLYEPGYSKNVCLKRFQSHKVWAKNVRRYLEKRKKPDVIYAAVPSLDAPFYVAEFCMKNKIRFVIDIQDLWPEAFRMVVDIPIISQLAFMPFKKKADYIYKHADAICAVSDTYCKRALQVNQKCKEGTTVFLGTELETFDRYAAENPILEKGKDEIWLAYCGTLGASYDLTCVMDALCLINDKKLQLIVMGDGPKQAEFEVYAKSKELKAVFTGRLQYDRMCGLLKSCDITVNPIAHMAAQSIINKHADYAASGLPVVSTQECDEYRNLIDEYQMGFNCRNNDAADLAEKIKRLIDNPELRESMGKNARRCAQDRFDRTATYRLLEKEVLTDRGGYCGLVKHEGEIWLGYAGTLGTSYDLPLVFEALRMADIPKIRFIIMGDGPLMEEYMEQASGLNVTFTGRLPYEQMCGALCACDMVVNPIIGSSAASIINKHADYAASGKAVLNTQKSEEYRRLVREFDMGVNCDGSKELSEVICKLADSLVLRERLGKNSYECAKRCFDRKTAYKLLSEVIRAR